jgi:retron-type reverse transcriptase
MKLQSIAQQAKRYPAMVFDNVCHVIDQEFLLEAYRQTCKNSALGTDQVTAQQYAEHLDDNRRDLYERLRDNRYVAPPVERVWIEKDDGKQRPIGKPCFEDKSVQRAVVRILEAIFEPECHGFSHGFRKGHSPHPALHELREQCRTWHIAWIVDADVRGCFDNLDWGHLREFLQQRVRDGGIVRLLGKWLHAGVLEAGALSYPDKGTPQGGVISPMVSNIFLHRVLDEWFVTDVQPRMQGQCFLTRFADDGAPRRREGRWPDQTVGHSNGLVRIAQMVVKRHLEPGVEPHLHPDSSGDRPGKSAIEAVGQARERCWRYDWVLDLDIQGFFDNIDHEFMLRAVRQHTDCPWVLLSITRWLQAPVQMPDGTLVNRDQGTPQGGVVSPLLANLFLHYTFDRWMQRYHPDIPFER